MDDVLPRSSAVQLAKCHTTTETHNDINVILVDNVPVFFQIRDGPYFPTLRLLHQYPAMMPRFQVDKGAIKFVLSGANIMAPGLTSAGGSMDEDVEEMTPVAIFAEGKQHAMAVGLTRKSAKDIAADNSGIAVDVIHYLNDGLYKTPEFD